MKQAILSILLTLSISAISQNIHFIKSYGNNGYDFGEDIKQDLDTGYIATGSSSSFSSGNADAYLLKVDSLGNFKWSYNYGGPGSDWGKAVVTTQSGGYAISGFTNSFGAGGFDFYLVKTDANGIPEYEKTFGGSDWDKAHDMVELPDGGFVMVGETYSFGAGNNDIYMIRTTNLGDTIWTRTYGGPEADYANAVLFDGDSLVVVGGTKSFGNGMTDGIILKYGIDGELGWVKTAGMDQDDYFTSIVNNHLNEYYIGGSKSYDYTFNCDCGYDFWIYKTSLDGMNLVDTSWSGEQLGTDHVLDIEVDTSFNDTYYGGSTTSWGTPDIAQGYSDAFINKLTPSYTSTGFIKNFGTNGSDQVNGLDYCFDKGIVGVGNLIHNSQGGGNMFIVRVDKANTGGKITVINELENEVITLSDEIVNFETTIKLYPTRTAGMITIENLPKKNMINIYNINGQKMRSLENTSSPIDMSGLSSGLYLVNISLDHLEYNFKVIKF